MKKNKRLKRLRLGMAAVAASAVMVIPGLMAAPFVYADTYTTNVASARANNFFVEIEGTFSTEDKQKILDRLNEIRLEACKNGYPSVNEFTGGPNNSKPLTMKDYKELTWSNIMETLARIRSVELTMNADHVRPNSFEEIYSDLSYDNHVFNTFENGSWYPGLMGAIENWYSEKDIWLGKRSGNSGHYMQLIKPDNKYVGIATFSNPNTDNKSLSSGTSILFCEDQNQPITYIDKSTGEWITQKPYTMPKGDTKQTGLTGKHTQIIEVANKNLQSLSIKGSTSLEVKKTAQLSLTANMKMTASEYGLYGTVINSSGTVREGVKWSSSNASVLKVDSSGKITALKEGKATITAEVAGKKSTAAITVKPETIAVTGITLDKLFTYPEIGQTITYIAKIEPENATNKKVTWSSDRPEVATVDNKGNVTGIKKGIAHITVTTEDGKKFARGVASVKDYRTGVFFVDNQWVYLKSGKINTDYTGLIYGNNRWYYMTKGVQDKKYIGLTQYNGGWWYIKNGTIDKSYIGITEYNKNSWYVRNGKVDKNYTGLAYVNNIWWYVNKGFVGKTYNGLVYHNKQWWYVSDGKLNKTFNSLFYFNNKWWYIKNGTIDKSYKGLFKYNGNLWYVVNGVVDKSYNGKVTHNGKAVMVKDGWGGKA